MMIPGHPRTLATRAWPFVGPSSLGRRIVSSVAIGLALVLVAFAVIALWTIQEATESAYSERVALAQALVWHVDDVLGYSEATLEREAGALTITGQHAIPPEQAERLAALRSELGSFSTVTVTDGDGVIVWTSPLRPEFVVGQQLLDPGVRAALASGTPVLNQLELADSEHALATVAVPIHDGTGGTAGLLMADLEPDEPTLGLLPRRPVGEATQVQLINSHGWVLAGSSPNAIDREMDKAHAVLLADLMARHVAGYRIHDPPPVQTADGGVFDISSHIVAYAPVSLLPAWGVVVEQPEDVVLTAPRQLATRLALAGVAMLLLAGAVAWVDVRRVVRPLQRLTSAARRFAAGDLDQPISLERSDELGVLAHAFETMRQRLRTSLAEVSEWNHELERRVAARTSEVERRNRELVDMAQVNAQLFESLRARERERAELLQRVIAGQEEERRRLAQELHDETSQALASLQLGLDRLAAGVDGAADARQVAGELRGLAEETLEAVHRLAVELRPSVLDDVGLVAALQRYLREWGEHERTTFDFFPVGVEGLRLVPAAETAVYRIVQAALTNVSQHADAQHVSVVVQRRGANLVVVVEDDGRGFDPAAVRTRPLERRLGLAGMEERAGLIGGTLTVESSPGAGSSVFLEVPLEVNAAMEDVHAGAAPLAG